MMSDYTERLFAMQDNTHRMALRLIAKHGATETRFLARAAGRWARDLRIDDQEGAGDKAKESLYAAARAGRERIWTKRRLLKP
jgi:hypothetical protein